jgi:hypothetical protein
MTIFTFIGKDSPAGFQCAINDLNRIGGQGAGIRRIGWTCRYCRQIF